MDLPSIHFLFYLFLFLFLLLKVLATQVSDGMRSSFMTLAGVGMMFYMSPQLAAVGLGNIIYFIE